MMQRIDEFRIFYNHTIQPELLRLERQRKRLLLFLFLSTLLIIGIIIVEIYIHVFSITFFLMIVIGFYMVYLMYRVRRFIIDFKPKIVSLILDFIDDDPNYGELSYTAKKTIPKKTFLESKIFVTGAQEYKGEDYIKGKIGELDFELCELSVREYSKVRNRLNYVFKGIFLKSQLSTSIRGSMLILPRVFKQYLSRTTKEFVRLGGHRIDEDLHNNSLFDEHFMTYATPEIFVLGILSEEIQDAILDYRSETGKEIYISFIEDDIYIAITEPKDILEPFIFRTNVDFELVKEFFEDITMILSIVEDFDRHH